MNFDAGKSAMCVVRRGIMGLVVYADRQAPLSYEHRITAIAHWLSGQALYGGRVVAMRGNKRRAEDKPDGTGYMKTVCFDGSVVRKLGSNRV
jgi:hypothetical protein